MNDIKTSMEVCVLTAIGRGAIATVALRGPKLQEVIGRFFRPATGQFQMTPNRIRYGDWCRDEQSELGESVVVCATNADEVEIHCHGGRAAVDSLVKDLESAGASRLDSAEWVTTRCESFLAGEYELALTGCQTTKAASIVLDQCRGAMRREVDSIVDRIERGEIEAASHSLKTLIDRYRIGRHVDSPFNVVIAGPPNVGKSSLINSLLGFERAIAFDQPGTTRDVITAETSFNGWMVSLVDTAGIRETEESIEREGVARAREQVAQADLTLMVVDASVGWSYQHDAIVTRGAVLQVWNKLDLVGAEARKQLTSEGVVVSATEGIGLDELIQNIVQQLVPETIRPGSAVPVTQRQINCLREAVDKLEIGRTPDRSDALRALERLIEGK